MFVAESPIDARKFFQTALQPALKRTGSVTPFFTNTKTIQECHFFKRRRQQQGKPEDLYEAG